MNYLWGSPMSESFASISACPQHVRLGVISEMPVVRFCRSKASDIEAQHLP
jgi:hypothetical protein